MAALLVVWHVGKEMNWTCDSVEDNNRQIDYNSGDRGFKVSLIPHKAKLTDDGHEVALERRGASRGSPFI